MSENVEDALKRWADLVVDCLMEKEARGCDYLGNLFNRFDS